MSNIYHEWCTSSMSIKVIWFSFFLSLVFWFAARNSMCSWIVKSRQSWWFLIRLRFVSNCFFFSLLLFLLFVCLDVCLFVCFNSYSSCVLHSCHHGAFLLCCCTMDFISFLDKCCIISAYILLLLYWYIITKAGKTHLWFENRPVIRRNYALTYEIFEGIVHL